jgi:type IV secretion system protein VirB1
MLDSRGYNFSVGLAQVNRHNLQAYGLRTYAQAFGRCPNLQAGARILARCHARSGGDWGRAFSCYYSGDFVTGFRTGYVDKVFASLHRTSPPGRRPDRTEPAVSTSAAPMPMTTIDRDGQAESDIAGGARGFQDELSPAAPGASRSSPSTPPEREPASGTQNASPIADAAFVF